MALSASTNFSKTAADLITEALALIGVRADEEPLEAVDLQRALFHLNTMLKAWQANGAMEWTKTEGSFTFVLDDADYIFGAGGTVTTVPFDITDVRITRNSIDMPMTELSREDYRALPNKTSSGYPTCWFYDRQQGNGTLYVWPVPDSGLGTCKFTYRRILQDIDAQSNNLDFPQEWYEAILYGLAERLLLPFSKVGTPVDARITAMAADAFGAVSAHDVGEGRGVISILPDDGY